MRRLAMALLVAPLAGLLGLSLLSPPAHADDEAAAEGLAPVDVMQVSGLFDEVTVEITSNGACSALVLGFLPNSSVVETTESFNASNVVTIGTSTSLAWVRPASSTNRVVPLNVRQGANGPILLSAYLTTTR